MSQSPALPSQTRPDLPCQQTDHVLGLQAGHCQPGLQQLVCGVPVPSTSAPSATICNKHAVARPILILSCSDTDQHKDPCMVQDEHECHHDDHCVGVDYGGCMIAGQISGSIPSCVVRQGGGRRGGGGGGVAVVCRPDSSAGTSNQHFQFTSPNSADRLAGSLARIKTPQTL